MKKLLFFIFLLTSVSYGQITGARSTKVFVGLGDLPVVNNPQITSIVVDQVTQTSFRVSWSLDTPSTGRIRFWETSSPETTYQTALETNYLSSHIQTIGGSNPFPLTANTSYTFEILGEDIDGNLVEDNSTSQTTLGASQTASIAATDATATEASTTTGTFTVTLATASSGTTTVNYTVGGTATSGSDYTALSGSVAITDGQTTGTITVTPIDDSEIESDETVVVTLGTGTGYTVGSPANATVTITSDDVSGDPTATIAATDATATEASTTTGTFTVTLSSASVGTTTVGYTVSGSATPGSDYTALSGSVDVTNGNTTATITVTPINDTDIEGTETVIVTLAAGTGYVVGSPSSDTVSITSDDTGGSEPLATVVATDAIATESGTTTGAFTIYFSEPAGSNTDVSYRVNGLAVNGTDYTTLTGTATVLSGNSSVVITVTPTNDTAIESDETVLITLEDGLGYGLGNDIQAFLTITSDDTDNLPSVSGSGTIANLSDFTNAANAGKTMTVTGSFSATGATAASGMLLVPGGGVISGTNINLNGSGIQDNGTQLFDDGATFSSIYTLSRVSPELFGGVSGDATDDNDAIEALINNCQYATATLNGSYIKNNDSYITRSGTFDWDMNGAKISTTSTAGFPMTTVSTGAVFEITNLSPRIYNGEFDGTDTYGRFFYLHGQDHYMFNDLYVHDLYAPVTIRCVAFRFTINADASGFSYGEFRDNIVDQVVAQGDGNYNNSPAGISKWLWYTMSGHSGSTVYDNLYSNNTVSNIIGDDAEAWYAIGGVGTAHKGSWVFFDNNISNCTRRATKACVNNVSMYDNTFTELEDSLYATAVQMGSMVDFFSTVSGTNASNFRLIRNVIQTAASTNPHYFLLAFTDLQDVVARENTIRVNSTGNNYGGLRLGSNTSGYTGDLANFEFTGNTFTNATIEIMDIYSANSGDPLNISGNTFVYNNGNAYNVAPIWWYGGSTGSKGYIDFDNNDITFNANPSNMSGMIRSTSANITVPGFNSDGCTINFVSTDPTYEVGYIVGTMSSSSITNLTITNGSGTPILRIDGTEGITLTGNTPTITVQ